MVILMPVAVTTTVYKANPVLCCACRSRPVLSLPLIPECQSIDDELRVGSPYEQLADNAHPHNARSPDQGLSQEAMRQGDGCWPGLLANIPSLASANLVMREQAAVEKASRMLGVVES